MRNTIAEALRHMRALHDTDTGRLRGVHLRHSAPGLPRRLLDLTPQPWRDQLCQAITAREAGTVTPDSPEYLVFSDHQLVVVLSAAGRVVVSDYPLSGLQHRHQQAAAAALADLTRHTLRELADRRAALDGRDRDARAEYDNHPDGALRIAPSHDPSNTRWVPIGADPHDAYRTVQQACHARPEQVLIITAAGYGRYGRDRHRLCLDVLCTMHQIAQTHQVTLYTVGNWLDAEGATTNDITAHTIAAQFTAAYIGRFPNDRAYTTHRMAELGWTLALHDAGIPADYLDTAAITRDWFSHQVRQIDPGTHDHIEVFHRTQRR